MEKIVFERGTDYQVMVRAAEYLGIDHRNIKKPQLAEKLNAAVEEKGEGFEFPANIIGASAPAEVEAPEAQDASVTAEAPAAKQPKAPAAPKEAAKKWYEGNFPYNQGNTNHVADALQGDLVEINEKNRFLKGKQMRVTGPASKANAVKGYVVNPKTGELQTTHVTVMLDEISLASDQATHRITAPKVKAPADTATATATVETPAATAVAEREIEQPEASEAPQAPDTLTGDESEQA